MKQTNIIIEETLNWVNRVVIGLNFCPFAQPVVNNKSLNIRVIHSEDMLEIMESLLKECTLLEGDNDFETSLLVMPLLAKDDFGHYLYSLALAEAVMEDAGYEGVYQLASFHPKYIFAKAEENDPANFSNRSPYPMFHLIREESLSKAIENFPDVENIPLRNKKLSREKRLYAMELLRKSCFIKAIIK